MTNKKLCNREEHTEETDFNECSWCRQRAESITLGEER